MNTKHLALIIALVALSSLNFNNLNAAEPALSPKAKANRIKTAEVGTTGPNLLARNPDIVASPKVLATWPQLARAHESQPAKSMAACACCKP